MAARLRDSIAALDSLGERQKVVAAPDTEQDVIARSYDETCSCLSVFYIRSGRVTDHEEFLFSADQIDDDSALTSFLCELYTKREYIPREILLGIPLDDADRELVENYLTSLAGRKIAVKIPAGDAGVVTDVRDGDLVDRHLPHQVFRALDDDRLGGVVGSHAEHPFPENLLHIIV